MAADQPAQDFSYPLFTVPSRYGISKDLGVAVVAYDLPKIAGGHGDVANSSLLCRIETYKKGAFEVWHRWFSQFR